MNNGRRRVLLAQLKLNAVGTLALCAVAGLSSYTDKPIEQVTGASTSSIIYYASPTTSSTSTSVTTSTTIPETTLAPTTTTATPTTVPEPNVTKEQELAVRIVIAESRGATYEGMCGVAQVIYDRVNYSTDDFGGHTISAIVYRGGQFAKPYWGDINNYPNAIRAVDAVFNHGYRQFTEITTYFFNPETSGKQAVQWLRKHKYVDTIGAHEFRSDEMI